MRAMNRTGRTDRAMVGMDREIAQERGETGTLRKRGRRKSLGLVPLQRWQIAVGLLLVLGHATGWGTGLLLKVLSQFVWIPEEGLTGLALSHLLYLLLLLPLVGPALIRDLHRFLLPAYRRNSRTWSMRDFLSLIPALVLGGVFGRMVLALITSINQMLLEDMIWESTTALAIGDLVFLGPLVEELLYRMILCRTLGHISPKIGIKGSALIFMLIHMWGEILMGELFSPASLLMCLAYFSCGDLLGEVYLESRCIIPSILLHMVLNANALFWMWAIP